MLGCETDACMAELGGALGADRLVAGDIAKLGESFLMHLRVVDVKKVRVAAQADRRLRGGTIDDVLDVLPAMVAELFPGAPGAQAVGGATQATPPAQPAAGDRPAASAGAADSLGRPHTPAPPQYTPRAGRRAGAAGLRCGHGAAPGWVEEPDVLPRDVLDRLYVLTDDDGLVHRARPVPGDRRAVLRGGREEAVPAADRRRRAGGPARVRPRLLGAERARSGSEAMLVMRGGKATLTCGKIDDPRCACSGTAARGGSSRRRSSYAPPFRRVPHLLARDDQGAYFLRRRRARPGHGRPAERPDYRLRFGRKGGSRR